MHVVSPVWPCLFHISDQQNYKRKPTDVINQTFPSSTNCMCVASHVVITTSALQSDDRNVNARLLSLLSLRPQTHESDTLGRRSERESAYRRVCMNMSVYVVTFSSKNVVKRHLWAGKKRDVRQRERGREEERAK